MPDQPTVCLVYDNLTTQHGGAEHVLSALHTAFPQAPLYTSVYNPDAARWAREHDVRPSFLQHFPLAKKLRKLYTPLIPLAFESHPLDAFDIVISVSSAEAKGVLTKPHQLHLCYLLTPTRYLYSHEREYQQSAELHNHPLLSPGIAAVRKYLRWWDAAASHRPDAYLPISHLVAERVRSYYGREPLAPLAPPVPLQLEPETLPTCPNFALSVSRLVSYKRIDSLIAAARKIGYPVVIAGTGPEFPRLVNQAGAAARVREPNQRIDFLLSTLSSKKHILFLKNCSAIELAQLYRAATVFVLPGLEDFGIAPLEAAWHGTPSILHSKSGVSEILTSTHAIHMQNSEAASVQKALASLDTRSFSAKALHRISAAHTQENFIAQFKKVVYDLFTQLQSKGAHGSP